MEVIRLESATVIDNGWKPETSILVGKPKGRVLFVEVIVVNVSRDFTTFVTTSLEKDLVIEVPNRRLLLKTYEECVQDSPEYVGKDYKEFEENYVSSY